jgi:hypothetical protein
MNIDSVNRGVLKFTFLFSLLMGGGLLMLNYFKHGWSAEFLMSAGVIGGIGVCVLLVMAMDWSIDAGMERDRTKQNEYFTPRLMSVDRQLQAFSARVEGTYQRGVLDWKSFAPSTLTSTENYTPDPVWGRGSLVRTMLHGLQVETTFGLQPLRTGERGLLAVWGWFVLAPGVTITASARSSQLYLNRFDANWSADEEAARGPDRLRHFLVHSVASAVGRQPMPSAVMNARERLIEKASVITCGSDHVFVIGRPLPRAPDEPREYGQGDFEVESLVDLVERTIAFVRALENS